MWCCRKRCAGSIAEQWPVAALAAALALAGCSAPAPRSAPSVAIAIAPLADTAFGVDGRLSARRGAEGATLGFTWRHDPPRDRLAVTSPLGQAVAELAGDAARGEVEIATADGRREAAADWDALTARALGFALPVSGLAAWLRGAPHGATAWTAEGDALGRAAWIRQDGWEITYSYADDSARRPSRLRLAASDVELRIVIERWD